LTTVCNHDRARLPLGFKHNGAGGRVIGDPKFEPATTVGVLSEAAVERDGRIRLVNLSNNPEITLCDGGAHNCKSGGSGLH